MTNYIDNKVLEQDIKDALLKKFGDLKDAKKDHMIIQNRLPDDIYEEVIAKVKDDCSFEENEAISERDLQKEFKVKRIMILSEL